MDQSITSDASYRGELRFSGVSLHDSFGRRLLDDLTFSIPPGARVGIVGFDHLQQAAFVALLKRYCEPTAGSVTIDGVSLRFVHSLPLTILDDASECTFAGWRSTTLIFASRFDTLENCDVVLVMHDGKLRAAIRQNPPRSLLLVKRAASIQ